MMETDLLMLVHDTAGHFEFSPLLDNLEEQRTYLNGSTVLDKNANEE